MNAVLIENPKAGRVSPGSLRVVERALEATFDLEMAQTDSRGHAAALAREAVEAGAKTVIAYGGDGTADCDYVATWHLPAHSAIVLAAQRAARPRR